jgi:hypothetical protein
VLDLIFAAKDKPQFHDSKITYEPMKWSRKSAMRRLAASSFFLFLAPLSD